MAKTNVKRKDGAVCDILSKINGKKTTQYYHWVNMLRRALNQDYKDKKPTYKDVTVCQEWMLFSNFNEWFNKQIYKEEYELDKDILVQNNKEYHPDKCCLIPRYINVLLEHRKQDNCETNFIGVCIEKRYKNSPNIYRTSCREAFTNKQKSLGRFSTPEEAHKVYCNYKYKQIKIVADYALSNGDIDQKIYNALLNYKIPN